MLRFGGREVEARTGIRADLLRDWRRHGHLADIGHRQGAIWFYDRVDCLILSVLKALLAEGFRIESAVDAAFGLSCYVIGRLQLPLNDEPDLAVVFPDEEAQISVARAEDVLGIENVSAPCSLIVDLKKLTRELPEGVKELWR